MPPPEKHSNTIFVPAQQLLVPSMLHSTLSASQSMHLPAHDGLSNLVDDIGRVVWIHLASPAVHALSAQVAVSAVPAFAADLLSPAKAQVAKRLVGSSAKSLAPVKTSAVSTDPWGMPISQCVNVHRIASVAPPAKSLALVETITVSTDPWGTLIRQCVNVHGSASVATPASVLHP